MRSYNTSNSWDTLLSNKGYLSDINNSVLARVREATSFIKEHNFESVINVGSGQGYLESFLGNVLKRINWVSIDISHVGLKNLGNFPVSRVFGYAHSLPFRSFSFDCCVCMEVIEHIPKKNANLTYLELKRILKRNGFLLITVPVFEPVTLIDHPVGHLRKFVPKEVVRELKAAGFSIVDTRKFFAFSSLYGVKSFVAEAFGLRRPSVYLLVCKKV